MRKTILFLSLFFILSVVSGCGTPQNGASQTNKMIPANDIASSTDKGPQIPKGTVNDLKVGAKVTVMGTAGTDGIVSATRITVGNFGPGNFEPGKFPTSTMASSTKFVQRQRPQGQRPQGGNGQFVGRAGGGFSGTRVSGEILKMDSTSLTIKNSDGGSKLVYYSSSTSIFIFEPPIGSPSTTIK